MYSPSFCDSIARSLPHLKVPRMAKITYFNDVLLSEWNRRLWNLIIYFYTQKDNAPFPKINPVHI